MTNYKSAALFLALLGATIGTAKSQEVTSPCPEVLIKEKYDHVGSFRYRQQGWDTVVTCSTRELDISVEPYIPVQYFNGTYLVEQIPYNPPDTSFSLGTRMPIGIDDVFANAHTNIPYPFYFFGIRKTSFRIGANGLVTFCSPTDFGSGNSCPWAFRSSNQLPWDGSAGHADPFNQARMRDAIYGVMEDTHPGHFVGSETNRVDGIYYGIQDQFPCRKIICSWKEAPNYGDYNHKGTYQIVCYEGSNIIEVHVKQRRCCPTTSDAMIGIQNATGQPQVTGDFGESNHYVAAGSPAAFWPAGRNVFTTDIDTTAYRFTPQGTTLKDYKWYRIFDDGRDSVLLTTNQNDTNGYYLPMNPSNTDHPTLTTAHVRPTCVSRYVMLLQFKNANNDWYYLRDTITIGIDTASDMSLKHPGEPFWRHEHEICSGENTSIELDNPGDKPIKRVTWSMDRTLHGQKIAMPNTMFTPSSDNMACTVRPDPMADTLPLNKIDSLLVQAYVEFQSGCNNFDTFLVRVFPNFDTTEVEGICKGERFKWHVNNQVYTQTTNTPQVTLQSVPGCDSVVHLDLTVFDVSHTIDTISDCKPVRWINGKLYTTTNSATYNEDTIVLPNRYGCDSVVQLMLTIHPMTARLQSSLTEFDYDHLDVILNDISTGNESRRWLFPTGPEQTSPTAYYSIPASLDYADIKMVALSPYGCLDTASIVIPFNKETFWLPNAFTPDDPSGNNLFGSVSTSTLRQEMFIYNRYGELVYHCSGVDCTWDGRDINGQPCKQGAYVYVIRYSTTFQPDQTVTRQGAVTLIR